MKTPTNEYDSQDQAARDRTNFCIEQFAKLWGPESSSSNDVGGDGHNNNSIDESAFSSRSTSFRYKSTTNQDIGALTLEVNPNAWDLPEGDLIEFTNNERPGLERTSEYINDDDGLWISTHGHQEEVIADDCSDDDDGVDNDTIRIVLEPDLRPSTPEPNSSVSKKLFEDHIKLAKEYLKVTTLHGFH